MTQSLVKALKLLETVSSHSEGLGLSEVARLARLPKGTVHRLLRSLVEAGYLDQMEDSRYVVGVKVVLLTKHAAENRPIVRMARPYLEDLSRATGETINLATLGNQCVVYLDEILTARPVGTTSKLGSTAPLHCTALGKAILAFCDDETRAGCLKGYAFTRYTERTLTSPDTLAEELVRVQRRGYAIDDIEYEPEKRCVGVPILAGSQRVVAAISISGPFFRITEEKAHEYGGLLRETSRQLSERLMGA